MNRRHKIPAKASLADTACPLDVKIASPFRMLAGVLALLVGGMVLLGWALDIAALKSLLPAWVAMKPNAAVAFVLIGLGSLLATRQRSVAGGPPAVFLAGRFCGWFAGLIGLLTLAEYAFDWNPGFDQWLFPEPAGAVGTSHPGRMAPDTAICFALLAVGYEFARRVRETAPSVAGSIIIGALVTTIGLVEILSYFSPALRTYGWGGLTMMALPTAILFTALGVALVGSAVPRKAPAPGGSAQPFARVDNATPIRLLLIFAALAISITAAGSFYYRSIERRFIVQVAQQLSVITDLKVSQLVQWRRERLGDATLLLRNPALVGLVRRFLAQPADADAQHQLQDWVGKYPGAYDYDQVSLIDAAGVSRLTIPAGRPPPSDFILQRGLATLRSGRMDIVDFYRSALDGRIYLALLVPVFDEANASQPLGFFILRIDPNLYLYPSIQVWPVPSDSAETLLVRRNGNEVLYLNDLRFRPHTALEFSAPLTRRDLPAVRAILGETHVVEGSDYRDVPVLAVPKGIPDSPWFLVAKIDREEAYAPIRSHLWEIFAAVVGFLFAAAAGVGLVWREQRGQYFQRQMKMAEELRVSDLRYRRLFETSKDGLLMLNGETGMVIDVNPFLVELLGFSHEEFLGKKVWELGFLKDIVANQANFAELQQKEYIRYENLALETKTGRRIEVEFTSNVYLVNHQKMMQCDIRDISERVRAQIKIRQLNAELEQRVVDRTAELAAANKELEAFSYSVSHDLRAPLRSIDGFSRIVLEDYAAKLDDAGRDSLNRIRVAAQRMGQLIDDMLNLSRVNRAELRRELVDLSALVREVVIELRRHEPTRAVALTVVDGLTTRADLRLLRIVLVNLLGNAWKFTGKCAAPRIEVGAVRDAQPATYFVTDNGAGFDETYAGKLFGAFQRLHTTEQFAGTGIGLATVQRIIHRHGGRVWAESVVGEGATFFFTLEKQEGAVTA